MRFVVIGAGCVGTVLGVSLEHGKHEVLYLLRKGRKEGFRDLQLVDVHHGVVRRRDAPLCAEEGARLPPFEWALLCVRGDQLDEAIATLGAHVRPDARVGVATARLDELARVRAAHPGGPVFSIAPTFMAWSEEPRVVRLLKPPLLRTLISGEGDRAADESARELAGVLDGLGLPVSAVASARGAQLPVVAAGSMLLAGWELSRWDARAFASDAELRQLTAAAMREAGAVVRAELSAMASPLALLLAMTPAPALGVLLRGLPQLTRGDASAMWTVHGPKIAAQTRAVLDEVAARAAAAGLSAPSVTTLRARLEAASAARG